MALKRSHNSFEKMALPYLNAVYRAAVALCGCPHEAEDMLQLTYLKAMVNFASFETGSNVRAWLLSILRNTWIDELRRRNRRERTLPVDENCIEQPFSPQEVVWTNSTDLLENFSDEEVIKALQRLPEDLRLTLFLMDVEQYSQQEVAQIMGIEVGTVKSRTSRARAHLKQQLKQYANDRGYAAGG